MNILADDLDHVLDNTHPLWEELRGKRIAPLSHQAETLPTAVMLDPLAACMEICAAGKGRGGRTINQGKHDGS